MKIVILSLVRNSGGAEDDEIEMQTISQHTKVNIGFLKVRADHSLGTGQLSCAFHFLVRKSDQW